MRLWDKRITFLFLTMILSALALLGSCNSTDTQTPTPVCPTALDEETLQRLTFTLTTLHPTSEMPPGGVYTFTLGVVECCYAFEPVQALPPGL